MTIHEFRQGVQQTCRKYSLFPLSSMDLEFQESSVVCIVPIHAFYLPAISAYEQRPPKIPRSQWYFLLKKLLSVGFKTQGGWPKDFLLLLLAWREC